MLVSEQRNGEAQRRDFGFPRDYRLRSSEEFSGVLKERISGRSRYFRYSLAPNKTGPSRIGLTVSRKVSGLSVQRNRIRRQIREFFRHNHEQTKGYDLVVMCIPGTGKLSNREIRDDLKTLWEKLEKRLSE